MEVGVAGRGVIHLAEPYSKTGKTRDHPLTGIVADIIDRWETKCVPVCPFVFHRKGRPLSYKSLERAWQQAARGLGLGSIDPNRRCFKYQGVNLHDTLRAFVTDAINSGDDPQTMMVVSGHKTCAMLDCYRILKTDTLARDRAAASSTSSNSPTSRRSWCWPTTNGTAPPGMFDKSHRIPPMTRAKPNRDGLFSDPPVTSEVMEKSGLRPRQRSTGPTRCDARSQRGVAQIVPLSH
jgi:hypothetical protein